jgi:hypothetical protein
MKARWLASGVAIGLVLALALGFAYRGAASATGSVGGIEPGLRQTMEAMHDSTAMEAMHRRMPERLQQQCDALHDQMLQAGAGMMTSGSGMMGSDADGMMGSRAGMMGF